MRPVFFFPHATIIDCGASRTTLAVFSRARSGLLRLERYSTVPLALEIGQEASWLQKTGEALVTLSTRVKPVGPVAVVLPPHLTLMKMLSTPRVEKSKREKIITFESQQSIPYPLTDVVWDRMISGENPHGFNVLLCAAKLEILDPLCASLAAAGLAPSVLLPSVLALAAGYRELQPEPAPAMPTLLVNIGARSTTLVLIDKSGFQARSLTLGGGASNADGARAAESLANRLAQEISRTLLYFGRPVSPENPLRLMLAGGAAHAPGLVGLLAKQLHVTVDTLDVLDGIEIAETAGSFNRSENAATLGDLLGGAVLQIRAGPPFNLLPPRLRLQAGRRRWRPRLALAAGLAVTLLVPAVLQQRRMLAAAQAQNVALERELAPLRIGVARNQEHQQRKTEVQRQQDAWQKIADARTGWLRFLGEMQLRFGATGDVWLERMQLLAPASGNEPAMPANGQRVRIAFAGLMQPKTGSEPDARDENYQRIRDLLTSIAEVPSVAAVENERFETMPAGRLRFEFVVVFKNPFAL